jgi:MFS family permease
LILMFITGFCMTSGFNCLSVMVVDLYPLSPATATAANNLIRCLLGAGATGVIIYMIDAMGRGWAFTFVAGVVLIFSPILWLLERRGPEWREARRVRAEEMKRAKEQEQFHTGESSPQQVEGGEKT